MIRTTTLVALAATLCMAALAPPASAQPLDVKQGFSFDPNERIAYVKVPHADLDAGTAAGAQALLDRITRAAEAVCGEATTDRTADCRRMAVAGAIAKMHSPVLTALASSPKAYERAAR